jgi:hypothetical protein
MKGREKTEYFGFVPRTSIVFLDSSVWGSERSDVSELDCVRAFIEMANSGSYEFRTTDRILGEMRTSVRNLRRIARNKKDPRSLLSRAYSELHDILKYNFMTDSPSRLPEAVVEAFKIRNRGEIHEADVSLISAAIQRGSLMGDHVSVYSRDHGLNGAYCDLVRGLRLKSELFGIVIEGERMKPAVENYRPENYTF